MNRVFLLTGGNMGDRLANLSRAVSLISQDSGNITAVSSYYETGAWGKMDQPNFLNQAIALDTILPPVDLLRILLGIEHKLGRVREEKYGPRLIDIDILLYGNHILQLPELKIPHPELTNRRFALTPLAEIAGEFIHPIKKLSINSLLLVCPDMLEVKKYSPE